MLCESPLDMGLPSAVRARLHTASGSGEPSGLYRIFYNRDGSVSFGHRNSGILWVARAEIVRAVPEFVIDIACTIFDTHRPAVEAYTYLKDFVLEKLDVLD
jgi:hypothetical protein